MTLEKIDPSIHALLQRLSLGPEAPRSIAFIAARRGEGTSTIARDYTQALARETGQKVLLIEAGASEGPGIVDMAVAGSPLRAPRSPTEHGMFTAAWVTRSENRSKMGHMLYADGLWKSLLNAFDAVIIAAPAIQNGFEGIALAAKAQATVLVVAAETTPAPVALNLRDTLSAAGAKMAGVVMNKRRYYIPAKVYARL